MYHVARMAFLEMALSGITTVGEFHYVHHDSNGKPYQGRNAMALAVVRAAREVGIGIVVLRDRVCPRRIRQALSDLGQTRFITRRVGRFPREIRRS